MPPSDESMALAKRALVHLNNRTTDQANGIMEVPATAYTDPARYQLEVDRIFGHLPLPLAFTVELPSPETYRAMTVLGIPVVLVRGEDSVVRAFMNVCRHRGAQLCKVGRGTVSRLVCPYHAWQYDLKGNLKGVYGSATFGDVDPGTHSLIELSCAERSGLIWVNLTAGETFDIDEWLGDMAAQLDTLDLSKWHIYGQTEFAGPNWKTAWDGYLESYHHAVVHSSTLGPLTVGNLIVHDTYGPHQRMVFGRRTLEQLNKVPDAEWDPDTHIRKIFHCFPNMAISGVVGGYCMVNQMFPGRTQEESITRQTILVSQPPETAEERRLADEFRDSMLRAIRDEDYPINYGVQESMKSGRNKGVLFGRNEPALQHFHETLHRFMGESGKTNRYATNLPAEVFDR
jgi:phenylpropionate dioxygenase-like ring-hydroxylating dioxygenase large terminal subunit